MSRLLFLLAIVVLVYLLIRSYRSRVRGKDVPGDEKALAEDMVRCAHCGVHLPKGESIHADEEFFCGAAHRDAHRQ